MANGSDVRVTQAVSRLTDAVAELNAAWTELILSIAESDGADERECCAACRHSGGCEKIAREDGSTVDVLFCGRTVERAREFGASAQYMRLDDWCPMYGVDGGAGPGE